MNRYTERALFVGVLLISSCFSAFAEEQCPRTLGSDRVFAKPWPQASTWYGTEALAVILPKNGIWLTTVPGHLIAVKVFWYSSEFQARSESETWDDTGFKAHIKRLDEGPDNAEISEPNWAGGGSMGENWTMLTGIDFPSSGCWEITGEYSGQSLTFVVETIESDDYLKLL